MCSPVHDGVRKFSYVTSNTAHFTADTGRIFSYGFVAAQGTQPATVAMVSTRWDNTDLKEHLRVTWRLPFTSGDWTASKTSDLLMPRVYSGQQPAEDVIPTTSADLVMMAPKGDQALAQVGNDVYVITVPRTGGAVPTVMVTKPDSAAMPVRKLTDIGGEFAVNEGLAGTRRAVKYPER